MDSDTLKARGTFFLGLGVLLLGFAAVIWSCAKTAETFYFRKFMASGQWPSHHAVGGDYTPDYVAPGVTVSNGTVSIPFSGAEQPKFYRLGGKSDE
jgi:hypothetical protein